MSAARARWPRVALPIAIAAAAIVGLLAVRAALVDAPLDRLAPVASAPGDPPGTTARAGSLYLPRGGPYILGFAARGPARLEVDGHVVAGGSNDGDPVKRAAGVTTGRFVLQPGVAAIRFAAPPGARLIWHPPGRRGAPEYVPATALLPAPPAAARFDDTAGNTRVDAAIVLAIAMIVAACALWLLRARLRRVDRRVAIGVAATFALALGVRLWGLGDAGQTWDEDEYWSAGRDDVQNLLAVDASPDAWVWNYEHPPVTKYLAGAGALWSDGFGPARAASALAMALGCALLVPIGARLYSWRAGVMAAIFAALSPHLVAHGQIVGHEAPTILWWSLALWLCLRAHDPPAPDAALAAALARVDGAPPPPPPVEAPRAAARRLAWRMAGVGVVLGLAVMTRLVNALLAAPVGVTLLALAPRGAHRRTIALGLAIIPAAALATSVAIWPRLWSSPLAHLAEALAKTGKLHDPEPFWGQLTATPPGWCFAIYVVAATPIVLLAAAAAWWWRSGRAWARPREAAGAGDRKAAVVVAAWLLAPLAVALSPVRQDGVRYVLPCLTAIALMAAAALELLPDRARARELVGGALALYLAVTCARVRPYYLDYYSEVFGGPAQVAADQRFVISWWGEGVDDAVAYVNDHAAPGARVYRDCAVPSHVTWFRGDLWDPMVRDPKDAEWIVWTQPSWRPCPLPPGARQVHVTSVMGAPLAYVYENTPAAPPPR